MKVLIVCHDASLSGANLSLLDWLQDSATQNLEVVCLLPKKNEAFISELKKNGCTVWIGYYATIVKRLSKVSFITKCKDLLKRIYNCFFKIFLLDGLERKIIKENINIIHSNSFATTLGCTLAMRVKLPHIWHIREFMDDDYHIAHIKSSKDDAMCRYSYAIFISPVIEKHYLNRFKFRDFTTMIDCVRYNKNYLKERSFCADGSCNILIAGAIAPHKGQVEAVNAIKKVHGDGFPVSLTICGQGDASELYRLINKEDEDYIHFLGYRNDLEQIRKGIDLALVCSSREALGRVTIEAMYYENLVIGADSGCTHYLVDNLKTGLLYSAGNYLSLASKIEYALTHVDEMKSIIYNAREKSIEHFSRGIASEICTYYNKCLSDFVDVD